MKKSSKFALLGISLILSNHLFAAGIKVGLESTSDLGNQFAGGAALADDATTNYYNVAGLTRVHHDQLVASGIAVQSNSIFSGTAFSSSVTGDSPFFPIGGDLTQSGAASSHDIGIVPAFHYSMPLSDSIWLGMSVTAPYGLSVDYGSNSILRYVVTHANAESMNISPSLAYQVNDCFSFGLGPDFMRFKLDIQNNIRTENLTFADSTENNHADGWGYGAHAGLLYQFDEGSRIGLSYRSQVVQHLTGFSRFTAAPVNPSYAPFVPPGTFANGTANNLKVNFSLPAMTMLSLYTTIAQSWAILATVDYTQWKVFKYVSFNNISLPGETINYSSYQNNRNTWHGAIAANYKANDQFLWRFGVGVDQASVNTADRSPVSPDLGYFAANIGMRYQPCQKMAYDFAYSHAFFRSESTTIARTVNVVQTTNENGRLRGSGDVFGVQLTWNLA